MKFALIAIAFSASAYPQELPFLTVSQASFEAAPCRTEAPSLAEVTSKLNAVSEVDQRKAIAQLTKFLNSEGKARISHCQDSICIVDQLWDAELGRKLLYTHVAFGVNSSEFGSPQAAHRPTLAEINHIIEALGDLPPSLAKAGSGRFTVAVKQREGASAYTVGRNAELYASWRNAAKYEDHYSAKRTILHETGHKVDGPRSVVSIPWRRARGTEGCGISRYGESNTREDFAEAFVAYRYDAHALKSQCLPKYEYMKQIYDGYEYLDERGCRADPEN